MEYTSVWVGDERLRGNRVNVAGLLYGQATASTPDIVFGDTDPDLLDLPNAEDKAGWSPAPGPLSAVYRVRLRDAIVHPPFGIITLGGYVLEETLGHIPFHWPGYGRDGQKVVIPDLPGGVLFQDATAVTGGNYDNYYHWLMDIIPKLQIDPFCDYPFDGTVLLPPVSTAAQGQIVAQLIAAKKAVHLIGGSQAISVSSLLFLPNLVSWGYAPFPELVTFFDELKRKLGVSEAPRRKIYITRKDSRQRVLVNQDLVEAALAAKGFEIVELTGLNLEAQARVFASASHIIAPHGAGLTNLVFCNPGVRLCELVMDTYLNWCFRRMAGIRGVHYGCIIGQAQPHHSGQHENLDQPWSISLAKVEAVLADETFMANPA